MSIALNDAQRAAAQHPQGPVLVLAGAGSGKTRVLTARISWLIQERHVRPHQIFAVTFTNKAAGEMRERVAQQLGQEPRGLWIGTFHALGARLLRREAERLGFTPQYTIYDQDDRVAVIKRLLELRGYAPRQFPPSLVQSIISGAKNRMVPPDELAGSADDRLTRVAAEIYHDLDRTLRQANAMDFDDLLLHPLTLFREHPDRLRVWQQRFRSVLVDEFQDTNRAQYLLIRALGADGEVFAVGDDDQSIYGWRGADVRNMLDFQRDYPTAALVRLEENYRSTAHILDAANGVIADNAERLGKTLFTSRTGGEPVRVVAMADERDEAEWIAREIRERARTDHYVWKDVGILFRTNAQSRAFEDAFRRAGIPYRIVGTVSFYNRREVKDLVAYLRLMVNAADDEAFLRAVAVPKRGLGAASVQALAESARQWGKSLLDAAAIADRITGLRPQARTAFQEFATLIATLAAEATLRSPAQVLEHLVERLDYENVLAAEGPDGIERIENIRELIAGAADWSEDIEPDDEAIGTPLERFLATAALTTSTDNVGGDPEGVSLMTVHTAKGLEWPMVVVAGLEDGLFPLSRSLESPGGVEEERRLAYVAVTRARDRLVLTWARARRRAGQLMPGIASRFLESLPPGVVDEVRSVGRLGGDSRTGGRRFARFPGVDLWASSTTTAAAPAAPDADETSQTQPRYVKGERVRHRRFGSGTILGLDGRGRDLKAVVAFDDEEIGTKQLLVAYAGLERDDWEGA